MAQQSQGCTALSQITTEGYTMSTFLCCPRLLAFKSRRQTNSQSEKALCRSLESSRERDA